MNVLDLSGAHVSSRGSARQIFTLAYPPAAVELLKPILNQFEIPWMQPGFEWAVREQPNQSAYAGVTPAQTAGPKR